MLELAAAAGEIDLKYLDESGFCAWSEPSYTYYQQGEQKHLEQTPRRGRRLSIIGFFQPLTKYRGFKSPGSITGKFWVGV